MARRSRKNIGIIGLGIIGSRVALALRGAGYQVFVWNRTPKPAPNFLGSPKEIAECCDAIQLFVSDKTALFDVLGALDGSLGPQHIVMCSATVGPEAVREAAPLVERSGASFLDVPFTGSKGAAEKKQLVYYAAGDAKALARVEPLLKVSSKAIVRCGNVGDASVLKVVTNMISAVQTQTLAEALALSLKSGLSPETFQAAIEQHACHSSVIEMKLSKMLYGDYDTHFALRHMSKDVELGREMARNAGIEIPATTTIGEALKSAINLGWGDEDYAALFRPYESLLPDEEPALAFVEPIAVNKIDEVTVVSNLDEKIVSDSGPDEGNVGHHIEKQVIDVKPSVETAAVSDVELASSEHTDVAVIVVEKKKQKGFLSRLLFSHDKNP